jgi:SAM-dependent methyltransferase
MNKQHIQEEQYSFPYHYLPQAGNGTFHQHAYWSWGYRYLGGMHVVKTLCDEESYDSLLDIGCGDGRFIRELSAIAPTKRLMGVDYSERAIALAKGMNPDLNYRAVDITTNHLDGQQFDVVTLVEVIEHIPPNELPRFIACAVSFLRPGGRLILTVPHRNNPVGFKHFQHFDSQTLQDLLGEHLDDLRFLPFDFFSRKLDIWFRLLGRSGQYFLITWKPLLSAFYNFYINRCVYGDDESKCGRIACIGRKPLI